ASADAGRAAIAEDLLWRHRQMPLPRPAAERPRPRVWRGPFHFAQFFLTLHRRFPPCAATRRPTRLLRVRRCCIALRALAARRRRDTSRGYLLPSPAAGPLPEAPA